jgi:hypothetical protein
MVVGSDVSALVAGRTPCHPNGSMLLAWSVSLPLLWLLVGRRAVVDDGSPWGPTGSM